MDRSTGNLNHGRKSDLYVMKQQVSNSKSRHTQSNTRQFTARNESMSCSSKSVQNLREQEGHDCTTHAVGGLRDGLQVVHTMGCRCSMIAFGSGSRPLLLDHLFTWLEQAERSVTLVRAQSASSDQKLPSRFSFLLSLCLILHETLRLNQICLIHLSTS